MKELNLGCFCMYRIKSVKGKPLIISSKILKDYSLEKVDTLHLKNLLMLGEDRYLTTLMLSAFPYSKICFNVRYT
jgi:chitin synthase